MFNILKIILEDSRFKSALCFITSFLIFLVLLSYDSNDPGFNIATDVTPNNLLGHAGANFTRMLIAILGSTAFFSNIFVCIRKEILFSARNKIFKTQDFICHNNNIGVFLFYK
nr:DNA translocase FtsK 4TM domain-containing protein [Orientia tsutsugamushi]